MTDEASLELPAAVARALDCYELAPVTALTPLGRGLINETYRLTTAAQQLVLQRVNPIFAPVMHQNIAAVTARLSEAGMVTPRLERSRDGALWVELDEAGVCRLMSFVPGVSFDVAQSSAQAHAAGALVGSFHGAVEGMKHDFVGLRSGVHDLQAHLGKLRGALTGCGDHRFYEQVAELGRGIETAARELPPIEALEPQIGHGDLKLNNILFAGARPPDSERPLCLIDLDTLGPVVLAHELGDMWRSWCNSAGEDATEAGFDMDVFAASWRGYCEGLGRVVDEQQRRSLLVGVEHICLELSARFAADALEESYFGFDSSRYTTAGEHNLVRARGQLALLGAARATRDERAEILQLRPT